MLQLYLLGACVTFALYTYEARRFSQERRAAGRFGNDDIPGMALAVVILTICWPVSFPIAIVAAFLSRDE